MIEDKICRIPYASYLAELPEVMTSPEVLSLKTGKPYGGFERIFLQWLRAGLSGAWVAPFRRSHIGSR